MDEGPTRHKIVGLELTMLGIGGLLFAIVLLYPAVSDELIKNFGTSFGSVSNYLIVAFNTGKSILSFFVLLAIPISVALVIGIVYCVEGLKVIRQKEVEKYDLKVEPAFENVPGDSNRNLSTRWEKVSALLGSPNENDWKQAVLEADIMLDDVLSGLGYQGNGIGEKLKRVQPGEFKNINDVWEAHKVRNQIAHDGTAFQLTHHEANRVIQMYKRVFEEFYFI